MSRVFVHLYLTGQRKTKNVDIDLGPHIQAFFNIKMDYFPKDHL